MASALLTAATVAMCPHGGQASFVPSQSDVLADSSPVLLSTDAVTIAGCPFVIGTVASPCLTVQWTMPAQRTAVQGTPVLLESSVGLCLSAASAPQGTLQVTSVQRRVSGT